MNVFSHTSKQHTSCIDSGSCYTISDLISRHAISHFPWVYENPNFSHKNRKQQALRAVINATNRKWCWHAIKSMPMVQSNPVITNPDRANYAIYQTKASLLRKYMRIIFLITKFTLDISYSACLQLPLKCDWGADWPWLRCWASHRPTWRPTPSVTVSDARDSRWNRSSQWVRTKTASSANWAVTELPSLWTPRAHTPSPMSWQLVLLKVLKRLRMSQRKAVRRFMKRFCQPMFSTNIALILRDTDLNWCKRCLVQRMQC